ncbi:DUF3011 domain-containing protein [Lysobacter sp. TY2-98]|uniref:DUF3011 domain-containing protein n=1 Tax=Lysobacter sp. TY2-98 TaxID=2290922 RepID=UPI000E20C1D5|nr:DUF3011 domain-containing protein [Lysobacter sp. TY2-98]AXK71892.1 DUF3011 domain-containing protein [Lysobacter sp. TY2-98]
MVRRGAIGFVIGVGACLVVSPRASAWGGEVPDGRTLRCESSDGHTKECPADASGGARLLKQLSKSPCLEGETWGRTRGSIWVTQGCRGEFLALSNGEGAGSIGTIGGGDRLFRCGSDSGRWTHCATRRGTHIEIVRQLSRSQCIRGQSWGLDSEGVWVSGGCRAEFRVVGSGGWARPTPPAATRFQCASDNNRLHTCAITSRENVRLVKQLSHTACIEGDTWGVDHRGVWVDQGCRAEFEVGGGTIASGR